MEIEEKMELIRKCTSEIVTEEELKDILQNNEHCHIYCGYEVSGPVHIGHMTTALKLLECREAGFKPIALLPDVHTFMNLKGNWEWITRMLNYYKHCFLALGFPDNEIKVGSEFQLTGEYFLETIKFTLHASLRRCWRAMDQVGRGMENPKLSQLLYAVMQTVDIKALDAIALGGMEQRKIHMLGRDIFPQLGYKPPVCIHTPLITALDGQSKMSSSRPASYLAIHDDEYSIEKKIMAAYCPLKLDIGNPLLEISKLHLLRKEGSSIPIRSKKGLIECSTYEELESLYRKGEIYPLDLKDAIIPALIQYLEPVRRYFKGRENVFEPLKVLGYEEPIYQ